jgi:hypothetical protein
LPAGPDNLPPKFLKAVFQSLVKPLTILFQKSLNFGVVPGDWKLANVYLGGRLSGPAGLEIFKI